MTGIDVDLLPTATLELSNLRDCARNPNRMDREKFALLVRCMKAFGPVQDILVVPLEAEPGVYEIVDGHHRVAAARELGWLAVPARLLPAGTSRADVERLRLSLNRIRGEVSLTDASLILDGLVEDFGLSGEELELAGFTAVEVDSLLRATEPVTDLDLLADQEESAALRREKETEEDNTRVFVLEIAFDSAELLKKSKALLRKRAGKSKDLALGFLKLAGLAE